MDPRSTLLQIESLEYHSYHIKRLCDEWLAANKEKPWKHPLRTLLARKRRYFMPTLLAFSTLSFPFVTAIHLHL
jgi:hypothetical protein